MSIRRIDVGELNGRVFLHKAVLGTFPGIAAVREDMRQDSSWRARFTFLRRFVSRVRSARRMIVEIRAGGTAPRIVHVHAVAVANNAYDEGVGRFFSRERLDRGTLTLYLLKRLTLADLSRLAIEMLAGSWRRDEALVIEHVPDVIIRTGSGEAEVMIDGEVEQLAMPLAFRIRPAALSIIAPSKPG
jgi:diacylglycerol kinase family enzyme